MSQVYKSLLRSLTNCSKSSFSQSFFSKVLFKTTKNMRKNALVHVSNNNFFYSNAKPKEEEKPKEEKKTEETKQKTEEKPTEKKNESNNNESHKSLLEKLLEQERSKETEVKIKTLFQQKENEIKEKDAKIAELHKKLKRADDTIEDNRKKINELRENLMTQIEEVNLARKRMEKEKKDLKDFAISKFAKDLLDVIDNLERAIQTSVEQYEGKNNDLFEGVNMTFNIFSKILESNGLKKINPLNEKFNPNFHEALFEITDDKLEAGTIGYVAQNGYSINERVLRAARVGVVKGASKPNAQPEKKEEKNGEEAKK